jgi:CBS-domain-containing membrane protein
MRGRTFGGTRGGAAMKVAGLMTKDVASCHTDESLSVAAERMWTHDCGVLPVLDGTGRVVGMVTDRDICMSAWMNGAPPQALAVSTAMSRAVHCCSPEDDLSSAEQCMRKHQVRRVPVIDQAGGLVGILSLADIVRAAARDSGRGRAEVAPQEVASTLAKIVDSNGRGSAATAAVNM